jgi:hypothetical protein
VIAAINSIAKRIEKDLILITVNITKNMLIKFEVIKII